MFQQGDPRCLRPHGLAASAGWSIGLPVLLSCNQIQFLVNITTYNRGHITVPWETPDVTSTLWQGLSEQLQPPFVFCRSTNADQWKDGFHDYWCGWWSAHDNERQLTLYHYHRAPFDFQAQGSCQGSQPRQGEVSLPSHSDWREHGWSILRANEQVTEGRTQINISGLGLGICHRITNPNFNFNFVHCKHFGLINVNRS